MTHFHDPYRPHGARPVVEAAPEPKKAEKKVEAKPTPEPKVETKPTPEPKAETKPEPVEAKPKPVEAKPTPEPKSQPEPLAVPPMYGPGSGAAAWRDYAISASSRTHVDWQTLSRGEIVGLLNEENVPTEAPPTSPEAESKPTSVTAKPTS